MAAVALDEFHIRSPKGLSAVLVLTDQGKERRGMQETADCLIEYIRKFYPHLFATAGGTIGSASAADAAPTEVPAVTSVEDELERELAELRGEAPPAASAAWGQQGVKRRHGGKAPGGPPKGAKRARHEEEGAACGGAPERAELLADAVPTGEAAGPSRPTRPQRLLCRFAEQCRGVGLVWFPHPSVDMLRVVDALVDDLAADRLPRTRSAHRLVPLQRVVSGFTADVIAAAQDLVAHGFRGGAGSAESAATPVESGAVGDSARSSSSSSVAVIPQPAPTVEAGFQAAPPLSDTHRPTTWAAEFSCRNNSSVVKNDVYAALGRAVPSVHLLVRETRGPATEATVLVEVVGRFAGVSVVRGFRYSRSLRYNVRLLTESEVEKRVRMAEAAAATAKSKSSGGGGAAASATAEATGSSAPLPAAPAPAVVAAAAPPVVSRAVSASSASSDDASDLASRVRHTPAQHADGGELVAGSAGELRLAVGSTGAADGAEDAADALLQYRLVAAQPEAPAVAPGSGAMPQGAAPGSGSTVALEITHTYTPPAARGKGFAQALTLAALRWAVRCGISQVLPSCSYVAGTFLQRYRRGEAAEPLAADASTGVAAEHLRALPLPAPRDVAVEELRVRVLDVSPHSAESPLWLLR